MRAWPCFAVCLAALCAEGADLPTPAGPWTLRYAQMPDQRPEWDAKGYLPTYEITWVNKDRPEVRIQDHKDGRCRGFVLVGRAFRVPAKLPKDLRIALEYETYCAISRPDMKRASMAYFMLLTPEQWQAFSDEPTKAKKVRSWFGRKMALYSAAIHRSQEDVAEWAAFSTGNLLHTLRPQAGKTVVIALVWGAAHFGTVEWGAFRSVEFKARTEEAMVREFFDSLNDDLPELTKVKAAYDAGDIEAAKAALVAHMKTRTKPAPPPLDSRNDKRSIAAADKICDHVFRFVGCPEYKLGKQIRWNEDPFNYDQWAIALNRHFHWLTLGRVYTGTKDEKYAREWVAQLTSWIDAMPVRIGRHWIQGVTPECTLSLDAGIRMGQTWFPTYYHFLHSPSFTVDAHIAMLRSFRDHALYLMDPRHFKHGSNWGMMELNGLYHVGVMLPEFKDAELWRGTAVERLAGELDYQFYPDGAQTELAPGYHGVSVRNALGVFDLAKRTGDNLPPELLGKLERAFDYYQRIMMPDGRSPALNDSGWGGVRGWLKRGLDYFPEREDWRFGATAGREGRPPAYTSCKFDWAGWYIMRTGWDADAKYLLLDAGPFSTGHQHEDKLHFILYAYGRRLITEPGTYSYDASDWRRYVLSARGHNTVLVDGLEQNRRGQRHTYRNEKPQTNRWFTSPDFDYAEGTYADGFGPKRDKTVTHTRRILFAKPRYWIVVDELRPTDAKPHTYEALFHLDAPDAVIDAKTKTVTTTHPTGGNVAIVPLNAGDVAVRIVKGQTLPAVQGWLPTGKHNVLRPIPTAIFKRTGAGTTLMAYALVPFEGNAAAALPRVEPIACEGAAPALAARLRFGDGVEHIVGINDQPGAALSFAGYTTEAGVALIEGGKVRVEH